jgi:hypothetical protein
MAFGTTFSDITFATLAALALAASITAAMFFSLT